MDAIHSAGKLVFHIMGDTGGVRSPFAQQIVASHMSAEFRTQELSARPAFLYLVGDLVYYYGQASEYYAQFYEPYAQYPAPILAVPGNHDGDVLDDSTPSLKAFVEAFCDVSPRPTPLSGEVVRDTMIQPNVYWTLDTPYATIIGLYTNVPEGGSLDSDQIAWFHSELESAPRDRALFVITHHPVYSGDRYHGGSEYLEEVLDLAMQKSARTPDAVFSGHVHNYQRYERTIGDKRVPYLVVGAGGYWHLHEMQTHFGATLRAPLQVPGMADLTLENYCSDRHGFLRVEVSPGLVRAQYFTVPRPHERWSDPSRLFDEFNIRLDQVVAAASSSAVEPAPMAEATPLPEPEPEPEPEPPVAEMERGNGTVVEQPAPETVAAAVDATPRTSFGG